MGIKYLDTPKTGSRIKYLDEGVTQEQLPSMKIKSPVKAAMKSASDLIGGSFAPEYLFQRLPNVRIGKYEIGGMGLPHAEAMQKAEEISKPIESSKITGVPAQLAYGGVQAAPIIAGVTQPFMAGAGQVLGAASKIPGLGRIAAMPIAKSALGFAGYEAAKAGATGQPIIPAAKSGAMSGALFHAGGKLGATAGQIAQPLTRHATRIGSALGAGGVSAAMAPEGEKISSGIMGGAFGGMHPAKPLGYKSPKTLMREAGNIYRNVLKPSKGIIRKVEGIKGENLDKFYRLAAKEKLPIYQTKDESPKLNTQVAQEKITQKISENHNKMRSRLSEDKTSRFDLIDIYKTAIKSAREQIKNAKELNNSISEIAGYIKAEIQRYGRNVDASTLDSIKSGMWGVGYNHLTPTAKSNARRIGRAIKNKIDITYSDKNIKQLNQYTSDLATLNDILSSADGTVVSRGKIGRYVGMGIGGMTGMALEGVVPIPGLETALGVGSGKLISDYMASPSRKVKGALGKMRKAENMLKEPILDKFGRKIAERMAVSEVQEPMRQFAFGQAGKAGATDAEIIEPKGLPAPPKAPFNPYRKYLPSPRKAGQSSGPVIKGQPQPKLPAPKQRPVFGQPKTPEIINAPGGPKRLPYHSLPEEGVVFFGEAPWKRGFKVTIGKQKKGQISKRKAKPLREKSKEKKIVPKKYIPEPDIPRAKGVGNKPAKRQPYLKDYDLSILKNIEDMSNNWEAGGKLMEGTDPSSGKKIRMPSTFPSELKNKGITHKILESTFNNVKNRKPLTQKQIDIVDMLLKWHKSSSKSKPIIKENVEWED